ncbi:hypothetical protein NGA_0705800 [Nannochloropsis gaditana CCMP526]|nr:hypothetical protein NGA_0705800 [Nannochloropsis gaditana CCMP526]EKU23124.1 hypothetical protein NGA_0705800 [Nannochloropsis gaditana CCMP526]|eukprot:XP_005852707.1 hypothetical protein NGA_0705800 [Nannochloropsis gaditana CCMP526]
MRNSRVR